MSHEATPYRIIVGLEVHVECKTATKMFCRCANDPFGTAPNTHVCPVCLGLPGALPVPNRAAVRAILTLGKALGATLNPLARWDRKHYFYPDLPKGYQISQLDHPFCLGGSFDLLDDQGKVASTIRFERAHLEEDAGKLIHGSQPGYSQVDLNRAGVPLIEMVTKPDITSATQARSFLQELQLLVQFLGISDAEMEKGHMRCDVNINIAFTDPATGKEVKTPITEVKNVNSTRAVERSITTETARQYAEWLAGGAITTRTSKITVGWDEDAQQVSIQRAKEGAADYRYLPEPDLPPVQVYEDSSLHPDSIELPLLPNQWRTKLLKAGVPSKDIEVLVRDRERLSYLEMGIAAKVSEKNLASWLVNAAEVIVLPVSVTAELLQLTEQGSLSFSALKPRLSELARTLGADHEAGLTQTLKDLELYIEHDPSAILTAVDAVLTEHADVADQYRGGNERVLGFLVGKAMQQLAGKAQPAEVSKALVTALRG
jgi:aspartyl-tRNA(Asn)/glutamyl-tRNA(Gln) amidotransferase subunit B